ncbi:WD40 repeat domain-containing protein [Microcoleus sp. FACHB-1515]|uniref:WD40 repeat domain-containing protein n=1 Tax=Cyanophyceae TaxID=3028117 RepID=UPI0016842FB9|nr:WD40 repeat domain-containing protein [Microcoleus sp. FACHB-1515]MBD2090189.1 WD40 repeat domain-containing protein [Microcoleus sp. FACHB-1515]
MKRYSEFRQQWRGSLSDYVTAIAWSVQGHLAASSAAGEIVVWSPSGLITLPSAGQSIDCLAFSPDGQFLAVGGQDGQVKIWRLGESQPIATLKNRSWVDRLAWSPTENQLAFSLGRYAQVWDAEANAVAATLSFEASSVLDLDGRSDGKFLALCGYQGGQVWNAHDWDEEPTAIATASATIAIAWSPDCTYIAQGNLDNTIALNEWGNPAPWLMQGFPGKVRRLAWSQISTRSKAPLLASASGAAVVLWERDADERIGWNSDTLANHDRTVQAIAFQPKTLLLASAAEDGWLALWQQGRLMQSFNDAPDGFSGLAWHPHGQQLAAGGCSGELIIWQQTGQGFGRQA